MKQNKRIIIGLIVTLLLFTSVFTTNTFAVGASVSLTATKTSVTVGESVTVTATAVAGGFNLTLTGEGQTKQIVGQTDTTDNVSQSASITFTASEAKTYTFTLSGDYTDFYQDDATTVNKTMTMTATAASSGGSDDSSSSSSGSGSGSSTPATPTAATTPNFKDVSKTVYATGDINLRSTWSTSSNATQIKKGTELRLTGTSTNTVNGYVWYRVTYEGQIKYVASSLVTETKPEEEPEKSSNVNLKTLSLEDLEISPKFSNDVTDYTATIKDLEEKEIKEIKVTAEPEDEKTTVKVEGNKDLKVGENKIKVTATAEDGTTKIFIIVVKIEDESVFGLATLKIDNKEISGFSTDKFNYEYKFENLDKLDIKPIANEEDATVEILGNENLVDGENVITIIVTSKDGKQTATYQIKAIKGAITQKTEHKINFINIIISVLIALIVLIIIILLILKYVDNKDEVSEKPKRAYKDKEDDDFDAFKDLGSEKKKEDILENEDVEYLNKDRFNGQLNEEENDDDNNFGNY